MSEKEIVQYKLDEEVKSILIAFLKTKTFSEVEDAISFLKESSILDEQSFKSIVSYLSQMPWIEVDGIMKVISSTTEKLSPPEDEIQPDSSLESTNS